MIPEWLSVVLPAIAVLGWIALFAALYSPEDVDECDGECCCCCCEPF